MHNERRDEEEEVEGGGRDAANRALSLRRTHASGASAAAQLEGDGAVQQPQLLAEAAPAARAAPAECLASAARRRTIRAPSPSKLHAHRACTQPSRPRCSAIRHQAQQRTQHPALSSVWRRIACASWQRHGSSAATHADAGAANGGRNTERSQRAAAAAHCRSSAAAARPAAPRAAGPAREALRSKLHGDQTKACREN